MMADGQMRHGIIRDSKHLFMVACDQAPGKAITRYIVQSLRSDPISKEFTQHDFRASTASIVKGRDKL
jgi:hypothetical protein